MFEFTSIITHRHCDISLTRSWRRLREHKRAIEKNEENPKRDPLLLLEVKVINTFTDHSGTKVRENSTRRGIPTEDCTLREAPHLLLGTIYPCADAFLFPHIQFRPPLSILHPSKKISNSLWSLNLIFFLSLSLFLFALLSISPTFHSLVSCIPLGASNSSHLSRLSIERH